METLLDMLYKDPSKSGKKFVHKQEGKKETVNVPAAKPEVHVKELDKNTKMVVYTCITGGYDNLITPVKTEGVDYICFTDNMSIKPNGWEIKPLPDGLDGLTNVKKQRMVKVLAHKYLPEYDISIWVDGSVEIKGNVREFIAPFIHSGKSVFIPEHPSRKCIYKETVAVKAIKKDTTDLPDKQMKKYRAEKFPENYGLVQSNIMVRWHNNEDCIELMEAWAKEIREFSHRDQLSFNYVLWKTKSTCFKYLDKKTCNSKYFNWIMKHPGLKNNTAKPMAVTKTNTQAPEIEWKKYFDHIYCIHYIPYAERYKKCIEELKRVGIRDSGIFSWKLTWDSPIFDRLYDLYPKAPSLGCMKVGLAHYLAIKEAYELGFKRVLILENDNIFLKDVKRIREILDTLPDKDIVLLDKVPAVSAKYEEAIVNDKINDNFIDIGKKFYVFANCYVLSRKGMEHVLKNQELSLDVSDKYLRYNNGVEEDPTLTRAAAITSIAIQNPTYAERSENGKLSKIKSWVNLNTDDYKRIKVKFEDYNQ